MPESFDLSGKSSENQQSVSKLAKIPKHSPRETEESPQQPPRTPGGQKIPLPGLKRPSCSALLCLGFVLLSLVFFILEFSVRYGFAGVILLSHMGYYWPRYLLALVPPLLLMVTEYSVGQKPAFRTTAALISGFFLAAQLLAIILYRQQLLSPLTGILSRFVNGYAFFADLTALFLSPKFVFASPVHLFRFLEGVCALAANIVACAALWRRTRKNP